MGVTYSVGILIENWNPAGGENRRIAKQHLTFASNEGAASEAGLVRKVRQQFA